MTRNTPLRLNRHLFTETGTDSGSLNVLGTLVHQFPDEGDYVVEVTRDGRPVGRELLVVSDEYHSFQATFDLASLGADPSCDCERAPCSCEAQSFQCIREDGYAVFHVSSGSGGYAVTVDPIETRDVREFDSTELREGDTFAATLLRPGEYTVRNLVTEDEERLTVHYPDPERTREAMGEAVEVEAADRGFDTESIAVHPAQGVVFRIEDPSRIVIELETPHEKAEERPRPGGPITVRKPKGPISGVREGKGRVAIDDLTTEEVSEAVSDVTNPRELEAILLAEKRSMDRTGATEAIEKRLRDLKR